MNTPQNRYSHAEARNDIEALADGLLSIPRQTQLQTHLAACPDCHAYQEEFLGLEKSLGALFQTHVPIAEYTPAENQAFSVQVKAKTRAARPRFQIPQWFNSLAWGSAVTLLMVGMAWILANTRLENRPPIEPPPSLALSLTNPPATRFTFIGDSPANQVAFSPDGSLLAAAYDDGQVRSWQVANQTSFLIFEADPQGVNSLAFAPNGIHLFTLGKDNSTLKIWQLTSGKLLQTLTDIPGTPKFVGISSTGTVQFLRQPNELILNPNPGVHLPWAPGRGTDRTSIVLPTQAGEVTVATLSPDGKILVTSSRSGAIDFWDITLENGQPFGTLLNTLLGSSSTITNLAFHPSGQWLASASEDGKIRVWDIETGTFLYTLLSEGSRINSLTFSANGTSLAASLENGTVYLWLAQGE